MKVKLSANLSYRSGRVRRESHGVWLPVVEVDRWIAWMLRQPTDCQTQYFALPEQWGLIALRDRPLQHDGDEPVVSVFPAAVSAGNNVTLWIATESEVEPRVPADWLAKSLPAGRDSVCVWLPRIGLTVFEPEDAIGLSDLLSPPASSVTTAIWTAPPEIPMLPTRFAGLALNVPMTSDDVLGMQGIGGEGKDIGDQSGDLSELGKDQKSGADKLKSWMLAKMEGTDGKKANENDPQADPAGANSGSGVGGLAGGIAGGIAGGLSAAMAGLLSGSVKKERDSQLNKLLEMTRFDPDKALRFAIPLAGAVAGLAAFRGLAIPGAKLLSRMPNFSLGSIGGSSGAADFWDVDASVRAKLRKAYHKMANREVAAGRYRRAAYIHANLIGNLSAAAAVLEQGGFFQEAAVLYRDRLSRPLDTARCWMAAGMYEQAAEIYASQKDYENESEAWRAAGRDADADEALEKAVRSIIARHQSVDAAKFIDQRWNDRDRALRLLRDQWPGGHQVQASMRLAFDWLGQRKDHDLAMSCLQECIGLATVDDRVSLAELTRNVARSYPDRDLQAFAADQCRVAVGEVLSECRSIQETDSDRSNHALGLLRTLEDPGAAFTGDVLRFRKRQNERAVKKPVRHVSKSNRRIASLPPLVLAEGRYYGFAMWKRNLFALQRSNSRIHASLINGPGESSSLPDLSRVVSIDDPQTVVETNIETEVGGFRFVGEILVTDSELHFRVGLFDRWFERFQIMGQYKEVSVKGFWPGDLQQAIAAVALDDGRFVALQFSGDEIQLLFCNQHGLTTRTQSLNASLLGAFHDSVDRDWDETSEMALGEAISVESTHIACLDNRIVIAAAKLLMIASDTETDLELVQWVGHRIHQIDVSPRNTRKRIALAHEGGLDVYWVERGEMVRQRIETERPFQKVVWMQNGRLFAIADQTLYRYEVKRNSVTIDGTVSLGESGAMSLLPLSRAVCGVAFANGRVKRYQ